MRFLWNRWLKNALFLYCLLYTAATLCNSVLYLLKGQYEDPNGNWHELDRAVIVLIVVLAYTMIQKLQVRNYWLKSVFVYLPTMALAFFYVWLVGLRDVLAATAYRDIFINYTLGYGIAALAGYVLSRIRKTKR